jgi:phosphatidylinositol dimannoside acyltransferase
MTVVALAQGSRRTLRFRSTALRVASAFAARLPERLLVAVAEAAGDLWYRVAPVRAAQGRLNLRRVCEWLVAHDMATERVRAAASDPAALELLLRAAFRATARYYLEVARLPALSGRILENGLTFENLGLVDEAIGEGRAAIVVGLHFGAIELPALYFARRSGQPVTIPMETLEDPELQAWFERSRGATGVRIVGLPEARRELMAALRRGASVGLVGDRDLTGGGIEVSLFGAPASLPIGPGLLALESGKPVYVAAIRRAGRGRYRGRVERVEVPAAGTRRERLTGFLQAEAQAFERMIASAPEQWWAVFFPIWSDLVVPGRGRHRPSPGGTERTDAGQAP